MGISRLSHFCLFMILPFIILESFKKILRVDYEIQDCKMLGHNQVKVLSIFPKSTFLGHLTYIIFVSLLPLIILQGFEKCFKVDQEIRSCKGLERNCAKIVHFPRISTFYNNSLMPFLTTYLTLIMLQNFRKILIVHFEI